MASTGPRSQKEAVRMVAAAVAAWMNGGPGDPRDSRARAGFTPAQRERYDAAWEYVTGQLGKMGQPRKAKEDAP